MYVFTITVDTIYYFHSSTDLKLEVWIHQKHVSIRTGVLECFPYMVALSTYVRLDENVVIDKSTYGDIDDDFDHIISYGHLCHAGRYIARHRNYIDMMEFPFDVTSIIQYQIDIGQLHWQILMKKHHFNIVSIKATLCRTDISADIKWYKNDPIPLRTRYRPFDVRNRTSTPEPR